MNLICLTDNTEYIRNVWNERINVLEKRTFKPLSYDLIQRTR